MNDGGPRPAEVRVLFGTETGNSEVVAGRLAAAAEGRGLGVQLGELNDVPPDALVGDVPVLVVIATTGDGEMPYGAERFWTAISEEPGARLDGVPFAVLGLGDTGYFEFCRAAEVLDERFVQLGGQRLLPMRKCDWDFDAIAAEWTVDVLELLTGAPAGTADTPSEARHEHVHREPAWNRERPYLATVAHSRWLTGAGALKPVCHVELAVDATALAYRAGDSLGVVPSNDPSLVAAVLRHLGESPDLDVEGRPLREVLTDSYEISRPSRELVEEIGRRTEDAELAVLLAGSDRRALHEFLWARDVLDLLDLPVRTPLTAIELLDVLSPLAHRSYSISSSPLVDSGDSLYADELGEMHNDGVLNRLDVAYSRDGRPKTYVQALMRANGRQLHAWLADGAYFYVCGDATKMAGDVDAALHEIVAEHGGLSTDGAAAYVDDLRRSHRYLRDVY